MSDKTARLKWYTAVRVDVADTSPNAGPPMELPDPDMVVDEAKRKRFVEYHDAALKAIAEAPLTKDLTDVFKDDFRTFDVFPELVEQVSSLTFDVEDVEGKIFGTIVCEVQGELLDTDEEVLKEYCRCLCDEMLRDGSAQSPFARKHGDLSIRIWRDRSRFLLTEREMEKAPWRKQKPKKAQKKRGGEAR